jgi:hypothetical protein
MAWLPVEGAWLAASDFEGTGACLDDGISIEGFSSLRRRLRGAFLSTWLLRPRLCLGGRWHWLVDGWMVSRSVGDGLRPVLALIYRRGVFLVSGLGPGPGPTLTYLGC